MKKLISLVLTMCMFGAFAMTASAAHATGFTANVVEKETTVEVSVVANGAWSDVVVIFATIQYNAEKLSNPVYAVNPEFDALTNDTWNDATGTIADFKGNPKYFIGYEMKDAANLSAISGTDVTLCTVTFDKTADVVDGDIVIAEYIDATSRAKKYTGTMCKGETGLTKITNYASNFTNYEVVVEDPVVTLSFAETTGAATLTGDFTGYTVTAIAPIGKVAVVTVNGTAVTLDANYQYTATADADTVVEVIWADAEGDIVALPEIYKGTDGIAIFAKNMNGAAGDCGFTMAWADGRKFTGATGDVLDGNFAATAVDGVFGVQFVNLPAGNYTVVPYVGATEGAAIVFDAE